MEKRNCSCFSCLLFVLDLDLVTGAGKVAALPEDLSSIPTTLMATHYQL